MSGAQINADGSVVLTLDEREAALVSLCVAAVAGSVLSPALDGLLHQTIQALTDVTTIDGDWFPLIETLAEIEIIDLHQVEPDLSA